MQVHLHNDTLTVTGLEHLTATNSCELKEAILAKLGEAKIVEVACADLKTIDSVGISVLISIHKRVVGRPGKVRLKNPQPFIRQVLQVLRLDQLLEVCE